MNIEKKHTCCFLGHKAMLHSTEILSAKLYSAIERLIIEDNVNTFLFGGKAKFDNLCFYAVGQLKMKYPHIRRIRTRVGFPWLDDDINDYLLDEYFDDAYYPGRILDDEGTIYQGKSEKERVDMSGFCIVHYNEHDGGREELLYDSNDFTAKVAIAYAKSTDICIKNVE